MSGEALLARWYGALKGGDLDAFRALLSPGIVLRWNGPPDLVPWAGEHRGVEAALAFFAKVGAALEVLSVETVERIVTGDRALLVLAGHWRVRATGQELHLRAANLFSFEGGLVTGYEVFPDSAAFVSALSITA